MTRSRTSQVLRTRNLVALAALVTGTATAQLGGSKVDFDALPQQPYPAEMMERADKDLALDVTWTGEHYIVTGDRGHVLVSRDGRDWAQVPVPVRAALTAVHFVDADHGWAVGHDAAILHTTDGGRTWETQNFEPELEEPFHDVLFFDLERGVAIGAYGLAYVTSDGGQSWGELEAPELRGDEFHLNDIIRLDDGRLFVAGEYGLLAVADAPEGPWRRLQPPYGSSLFGALPLDNGGVLVYGLRGNAFVARDLTAVPDLDPDFDPVLGSDDGLDGEGWETVSTGTTNSMFGGVRMPNGNFALVGLNGQIVRLTPEAEPDNAWRTASESPLASAQLGPDHDLILVGESGIEHFDLP
ncbi:WD40/YVTN/BNR-like repeat-containing protein [Algiphilus sp.]|uniref:WD40/YVTN/BNR-like repeat-containing protein n=1 Tax=Algiphilus sp. TaxID=1872431 RepID=UPI0025C05F01|nr:YCF48-related protein [Algiphilus sp.]MCK5768786.1 hypothetical protein [Algiphilus sp.]